MLTFTLRCAIRQNPIIQLSSSLTSSFSTKTSEQKGFFKRLFDDGVKKERQTELNAELEGGVFPQFKEYRKTSGKLFRADEKLIGRSVAPVFPTIKAKNLLGEQVAIPPLDGKTYLIGLAYNQHSLTTFETWKSSYLETFGSTAPFIECTITESSFLSMFSSSVSTSLKNVVAKEHHHCHVPIFDRDDNNRLKESLIIKNTLPLYVFLVDQSYVRWRGTGEADEEELEWMNKCAKQLNEPGRKEIDDRIPKWQQIGTDHK